jgi:hypothetical protein
MGRSANMENSPSIDRNSAGLNFTEPHRGQTRLIQSGCGSQSGQSRSELLKLLPLPKIESR